MASELALAIKAYAERFGEWPALMQLPADERETSRLLREAVDKGDPAACYPPLPPGAVA